MTASIHAFPAARRVQPHAIDLSRAVPADDAAIEQLRRQTRAVIAARSECQRAELISALLLELEAHPLTPCLCYPVRPGLDGPMTAPSHVIATVGDTVFKLLPADARTAADALIAEQAFPGCVGVAADLREAAAVAETRTARGGPLSSPSLSSRPLSSRPERSGEPGRTGMATTIGLVLVILCALALSAWGL